MPPPAPAKRKRWFQSDHDLPTVVTVQLLLIACGGTALSAVTSSPARLVPSVLIYAVGFLGLHVLVHLYSLARQPGGRRGYAHRTLLWLGIAGMLGLILVNLIIAKGTRGSAWPLFLAGAGCLYLWWLASLVFDLVFVWHRYIQHDVAIDFLRHRVPRTDQESGPDSAADGPPEPTPPSDPQPGGFRSRFRKRPPASAAE